MKKVYLHVGVNKCGSTSIQDYFKLLNMMDINYRYFSEEYRLGADITMKYGKSPVVQNAVKLRIVKKFAQAKEQNLVFSSENFWTLLFQGDDDTTDWVIRNIKNLFDFAKPKILIVIRRQDKLLESSYLWRLKAVKNFRQSFADFLKGIQRKGYDFNSIIQRFESTFGIENIVVIPFELLLRDSGAFQTALLHFLDIQVTRSIDFEFPHRNVGINAEGVEYLLHRTEDIKSDHEQKQLRAYVERTYPKTLGEKPILYKAGQREEIVSYFAKSNAELFSRYSLDASLWD